jgi:hypothetical protein
MKRTYNTGIDSNQIEFDVSVGTVGVASTVVAQRWSGGTFKVIRESDADSGNVPEFVAGTAAELRNSYIVCVTVIDFCNIPPDQWEQARKTIAIFYTLDGGFSGHQYFNYDTDDQVTSQGGKIIVITKPIEMQ